MPDVPIILKKTFRFQVKYYNIVIIKIFKFAEITIILSNLLLYKICRLKQYSSLKKIIVKIVLL